MGIRKIIAFESDHNGGKWSQIEKITELAEILWLEVITTRGSIYREGRGRDKWDPDSPYWRKRMADYPLVDQMTKEERFEFEKENIIRLRRELNIAINRHLIRTQKDLLLILDRSEISGYFWLKKLFSSLTFEDYLNFTDVKGNRVDIIKPDIVFALQVGKEELLQRNVIRGESNTSRNKEREKNIQYYHQLFEETLEEVEGLFDICYIDGNRSKEEIFQEIKKKLKELWLI